MSINAKNDIRNLLYYISIVEFKLELVFTNTKRSLRTFVTYIRTQPGNNVGAQCTSDSILNCVVKLKRASLSINISFFLFPSDVARYRNSLTWRLQDDHRGQCGSKLY